MLVKEVKYVLKSTPPSREVRALVRQLRAIEHVRTVQPGFGDEPEDVDPLDKRYVLHIYVDLAAPSLEALRSAQQQVDGVLELYLI